MSDILKSYLQRRGLLIGLGVFILTLGLYISTLAPGLVFGDPSEYTFVPHIWGISHPPGYAFQTVLGGIWQRMVPVGSIAYRANLLSAFAGALIAALVYGSAYTLTPDDLPEWVRFGPGLVAGFSAAAATDIWQHSIHTNAHITSALLATTSLFLLLRWWRSQQDGMIAHRWLFAFCVVAGLSVTHHPLLVFSFPAYTVFIIATFPSVILQPTWRVAFYSPRALLDIRQWPILLRKPNLLINWRMLLKMMGFALLGLSVWLYLPIRASLPAPILFGPTNTNMLNGFLDLALARGLRVNLFHFGLQDQWSRWVTVFGSLLRLQAGWPVIALMVFGLYALWRRTWRVGLLFTVYLLVNLAFVLNTIQDVMAYLMVDFSALMMLAGIGAGALVPILKFPAERETRVLQAGLAVVLVALPILRAGDLEPVVSLRHYDEAQRWIDEVYDRFEGQGEGAVLLAHWEHLTPLWYEERVEDHALDEADVSLVFVATTSERPWVDNTWANIDRGPIYVSGYQPELIAEGFRLRPVTRHMYQVIAPPADQMPDLTHPLNEQAGPITLVGVDLPLEQALPGQIVPLTIALSVDEATTDIIFPAVTLTYHPEEDDEESQTIVYAHTTDGHVLSPAWQPGEIIVERYDLRLPLDAEPGRYTIAVSLRNLSTGEMLTFDGESEALEIADVRVGEWPKDERFFPEEVLMANLAQRVGLVSAVARGGGQRRIAVWNDPIAVKAGESVVVRLTWTALYPPDENWKVFVHLVGNGQVIVQQDAPPLGGAFPTFLWFPKWVPGQTVVDPYRLTIPEGTPPGEYSIEVGMYGFFTQQRAPYFDPEGNLSGDRFILGVVRVEP